MSHSFHELLSNNRELRQLAEKSQQLQKIQRLYAKIIPATLQQFSRVMSLENGIITLAASSGVVAAKLRHSSSDLLESLQQLGIEARQIMIKVHPDASPPPTKNAPRELSNIAQQEIVELANHLADSPLKASLKRLAAKRKSA